MGRVFELLPTRRRASAVPDARSTQPGPAVAEESRRAHYWRGLDGLRAVAVLAVVLYHLDRPEAKGGYLGVDVFFVLSGFLITDILLREHDAEGGIRFRNFYVRRVLRLLPVLVVVALVCLAVSLAEPDRPWAAPTLRGMPFVLAYTGNWARAVGTDETLGLLAHTWSLAIEEQYYLIWPLVLALVLVNRLRRRTAGVVLCAAAVLVGGYRLLLVAAGSSGVRIASGTDTHADGLLLGSGLAFLLVTSSKPDAWPVRWRNLVRVGAVVGVLLLAVLVTSLPADASGSTFGYSLAALGTALVVLALATDCVPWMAVVLESRPALWVGRRSYGLYLWHVPVFALMAEMGAGWRVPESLVAVIIALVVTAASFRYLEKPFLRLKRHFL